jgi:hypothetical protein
VKITPRAKDPRTEPLPLALDDRGLAEQVQSAPTPEAAWAMLGLPGGRQDVDPTAVAALAAAATALCATSDAIGLGLKHFGELSPDEDPPVTWVDRMVALYVQELEGFWALDDLAYQGLKHGGWTVNNHPTEADPATRLATRARWQAAHLKPRTPALALDKLERLLSQEEAIGNVEGVRLAGKGLVMGAALHRFSRWRIERRRSA